MVSSKVRIICNTTGDSIPPIEGDWLRVLTTNEVLLYDELTASLNGAKPFVTTMPELCERIGIDEIEGWRALRSLYNYGLTGSEPEPRGT